MKVFAEINSKMVNFLPLDIHWQRWLCMCSTEHFHWQFCYVWQFKRLTAKFSTFAIGYYGGGLNVIEICYVILKKIEYNKKI